GGSDAGEHGGRCGPGVRAAGGGLIFAKGWHSRGRTWYTTLMSLPAPKHVCPRCGYDVSGPVPTWSESCPLGGTCSECGLTFAWVDIFRPDRIAPAWSFEHARERLPARWFETVGRALAPSVFWSRVRLGARLRHGRLMEIALPLLLLGCVVSMACGTRWGYLLWSLYNTPSTSTRIFWR